MLTRERLWRCIGGAGWRGLPWALAGCCLLPWLLPEGWEGRFGVGLHVLGWGLAAAGLPLLAFRRLRALGLALVLGWITLLGLAREARWERALPRDLTELSGSLAEPWRVRGERRLGALALQEPAALRGCVLPLELPADGEAPPPPGTPVRLRAELRPVEAAPVFLGERPLWRARDAGSPRRIRLRSALQFEVLGPARPGPLLRLRCFLQRRFEALPLPEGPARDLWGALSLGIPPAGEEVYSAFAESGTLHTLVVSGLQVTLVMVFAEALARRLLRRGAAWVSVATGLLYCAAVGFSAPVWRGLLMGLAWAAGRGSGWRLPPLVTLHGALLLWLLFHPASGADPGFLLAWFALLGLLWGMPSLEGLFAPLLGRFAHGFAVLLAPWLSTLPLLALFHGGAPLWGVAANACVIPLVGLATPLCLLLLLLPLGPLAQSLGLLLGWMGERLVPFFTGIAPLGTGLLAPWFALLLGWLALAHRTQALARTRALALGLLGTSLGLLATGGTGRAPRTLELEAPDLGGGEALLLRVPGGRALLVDSGGSPWAARRLARILSRRGVREEIRLVLSHPHGDHAGGWATLARLRPFAEVRGAAVADPGAWGPFAPGGVPPGELLRGVVWREGEAEIQVRWPVSPMALADLNMVSAVLKVAWQDRELWLMGDALAIQERDLLDLGDPALPVRHRLLKPGHHGSRSACDPAWLAALRPELALMVAARDNPFGHPHPEALAALKTAGSAVAVTGPSAGLRVRAGAGGWEVEDGRGGRWRVPFR